MDGGIALVEAPIASEWLARLGTNRSFARRSWRVHGSVRPASGVALRRNCPSRSRCYTRDMGEGAPGEITQLLRHWRAGDRAAQTALFEAIYPELRKIAASRVRSLAPQATIHPTELIHETWIRLTESREMSFEDRARFYAASATIMRHILVDRARAKASAKRTPSDPWPVACTVPDSFDYLGISDALDALQTVCERQARQVDLRFFGGFSAQETAEILGISMATLKRDWLAARMFIKDFIENRR